METTGGASVLGRDDIGVLRPGMAADFIGVPLNTIGLAGGAVHDPLASLFLCSVPKVDLLVINGKIVVEGGELRTIDLERFIVWHNEIARHNISKYPVPERFKLV